MKSFFLPFVQFLLKHLLDLVDLGDQQILDFQLNPEKRYKKESRFDFIQSISVLQVVLLLLAFLVDPSNHFHPANLVHLEFPLAQKHQEVLKKSERFSCLDFSLNLSDITCCTLFSRDSSSSLKISLSL